MKGKIVLENGEVFEGGIICGGAAVTGRLVFDTRVVGYEKVLTSPEYAGKIVCFTYPLVGNYGVCAEDIESDTIYPAGVIISEYSEIHSNFRAECSLKDFLKNSGVTLICGADTQYIAATVRENPSMRAVITPASSGINSAMKLMGSSGDNSAEKKISAPGTVEKRPAPIKNKRFLAVIDLGLKKSERAFLDSSGIELVLIGEGGLQTSGAILRSATGIYISSGREDIRTIENTAALLSTALGKIPVFGTGLGHIIAGVALGATVSCRNVNHYGINQPVSDIKGRKYFITEQAHSLVLDKDSVSRILKYVNVNDASVEGLEDKGKKLLTTAFNPAEEDFRSFLTMIKE